MIGNEEGTGGSSTLNRTPQTPQKAVAKRVHTTDPPLQPETHTPEREPQLYSLRSPTFMPQDPINAPASAWVASGSVPVADRLRVWFRSA